MNSDHVHDNDVLCGRGGGTNNHKGNIIFRQMVANRQSSYLTAQKNDKKLVAKTIVDDIRRDGGKFVKYDDRGYLVDIGDIKANEKTCQALREGMDIRTHRKEQNIFLQTSHERADPMSSTVYSPHIPYQQSPQDHNSLQRTAPPSLSNHVYGFPFQHNYDRAPYKYQKYYRVHQQQYARMHSSHEEENPRYPSGCRCMKSNCLKLYCRCFLNSSICHPDICCCKDCYNSKSNIQEIYKARSIILEKNKSAFHRHEANSSMYSVNRSENQYLHGNCHIQSQPGYKFPHAQGYPYQDILTQGATPATTVNSQYVPQSSNTSHFQNDRSITYRASCKCQKIQCLKRYCECFNSGIKCSQTCQCVDCKNKES